MAFSPEWYIVSVGRLGKMKVAWVFSFGCGSWKGSHHLNLQCDYGLLCLSSNSGSCLCLARIGLMYSDTDDSTRCRSHGWHSLKPGLDSGLWTLDYRLCTLECGLEYICTINVCARDRNLIPAAPYHVLYIYKKELYGSLSA